MGSSRLGHKKQKEEFLKKETKVQKLTEVETLFPFMKNSFEFISSLLEVNETTIESVYNNINEKNVKKIGFKTKKFQKIYCRFKVFVLKYKVSKIRFLPLRRRMGDLYGK